MEGPVAGEGRLLPRPVHRETSRRFWESAQRGELLIPKCNACGELFFYPRQACPRCLSSDLDWTPASGLGSLYSYSVVHQPADPRFIADVPHVLVIVELDEGPRLFSSLLGCPPAGVEIGMRLRAVFDAIDDEWTLVRFTPITAGTA